MKVTDEQIEKVARAAFFARYPQDPHTAAWDETGGKNQLRWYAVALAALAAVMPEGGGGGSAAGGE